MANFFDDGSPYLSHPLLTPERSAAEAEQLAAILALQPSNTVLDVGCGFGRHTVALAALGYRTVGIDPSATMIAAARDAATTGNAAEARFRIGSGQDLTETDHFDAAICMFTSLGQVGPDGNDNRSMLAAVARAVRPGGRLVVEVPVRERAVATLVTDETFGAGDNRTEVTRSFDAETSRIVERFALFADGQQTNFDLSYHLFSPPDLVGLLEASGFEALAVRSSLEALNQPDGDAVQLSAEDGFMLALAAVR